MLLSHVLAAPLQVVVVKSHHQVLVLPVGIVVTA
jgi:hypothetical protein